MLQDDGEVRKSAIDNNQIARESLSALIIDKKQMPEISSQMLDSPEIIAANQTTNPGKFKSQNNSAESQSFCYNFR